MYLLFCRVLLTGAVVLSGPVPLRTAAASTTVLLVSLPLFSLPISFKQIKKGGRWHQQGLALLYK